MGESGREAEEAVCGLLQELEAETAARLARGGRKGRGAGAVIEREGAVPGRELVAAGGEREGDTGGGGAAGELGEGEAEAAGAAGPGRCAGQPARLEQRAGGAAGGDVRERGRAGAAADAAEHAQPSEPADARAPPSAAAGRVLQLQEVTD